MLEEWMHDPKVLATFAVDYETNKPVYPSVSFDLHNMPPQTAKLEQAFPENIKKFFPFKPVRATIRSHFLLT
jgi:hypothetical protein